MNYEELADRLVNAINSRRIELGIKDGEPGKLLLVTTSQQFNDWINNEPDNSERIALGSHCPLLQHMAVNTLPNDPRATVITIEGTTIGFLVDRLDEEAWQRKQF